MSDTTKEYVNREGVTELKVRYLDGIVEVEDKAETTIKITNEQARWLATELDESFGGGSKNKILEDRMLFFTGVVTDTTVTEAQKTLVKLAEKWMTRSPSDRGHITIFINTPGGYISSGIALIETVHHLRGMGIPFLGMVQGEAYSMGSLLLQSCDKRLVTKYSRVMVHEMAAGTSGKLHHMDDRLQEFKKVQKVLAGIYADRNTAGNNNPRFWDRFMTGKDKFLTGEECVKLGLADGIYDPLTNPEVKVP